MKEISETLPRHINPSMLAQARRDSSTYFRPAGSKEEKDSGALRQRNQHIHRCRRGISPPETWCQCAGYSQHHSKGTRGFDGYIPCHGSWAVSAARGLRPRERKTSRRTSKDRFNFVARLLDSALLFDFSVRGFRRIWGMVRLLFCRSFDGLGKGDCRINVAIPIVD